MTREELVKLMAGYIMEHAMLPTIREYQANRGNLPDESTIRVRFGGWDQAWREALTVVADRAQRWQKRQGHRAPKNTRPHVSIVQAHRAWERWVSFGPYPATQEELMRRLLETGRVSEASAKITIRAAVRAGRIQRIGRALYDLGQKT